MNDDTRDLFSRQDSDKEDLLNELDSLKELLDEPAAPVAASASTTAEGSPLLPPSHITTVEEYFRWKAEQEAAAQPPQEIVEPEEEDEIPTLVDVVELQEEEPAATALAEEAIPLLDEVVSLGDDSTLVVPELVDVVSAEEEEAGLPSNEELMELVNLLVERRLNKLRETLTDEVMAELSLLYPALQGR